MSTAILTQEQSKKVCIVIPVYNAEKYLGYCLNSVLSQTYTNWCAILVDDGSTDHSLEICRRYASLDSRFHVLSKPNGGVSSARNAGLFMAEGDYLSFLDSDDCLSSDALEKQVRLAVEHNSDLVVTNSTILDFNNPLGEQISLQCGWLKESPCVLDAAAFREKQMRLILYTASLEGPCAKLYDLALWKKLNLQFPTDMSLGEDFTTNMLYYQACNSAVFLNETCYYYNQYLGSGSLTEKYRPDLFEIKMFLNEKLEAHLGGRATLSKEELEAFYSYVASSGLTVVEKTVLSSGLEEAQLYARVQEIFSHPLFAESLQHAHLIPDRFAACKKHIKRNALNRVIEYIASGTYNKTHGKKKKKVSATKEKANAPGLLNRITCLFLQIMIALAGSSSFGKRLGRLKESVEKYGVKLTFRPIFSKIGKTISVRASLSALRSQVASLNTQFAEQTTQLQEKLDKLTLLEQQYTYQTEINELRQRKKAIMLATAEHSNIGDAAITLAEQQILSAQFPEYFQVEISTYEFSQKEAYLHAILNPEDIIFIHGGGNIGDIYPIEEDLHRKIVSEFPDNKIIIFPQTICFFSEEEIAKSAKIYNRHKDLTLFVRGNTSLEFAKKHFPNLKVFLMTDSVQSLSANYAFDRNGALLCLRTDCEGNLGAEDKQSILLTAQALAGTIDFSTNIHSENVIRENRGLVVRKEFMRFAQHQVVITDRLHGMIFSAVTNTPCVVLSISNHKIREYYEAFFQDSNAIFFIGDNKNELEEAMKKALQVTEAHYPIFEARPHKQIRNLSMPK